MLQGWSSSCRILTEKFRAVGLYVTGEIEGGGDGDKPLFVEVNTS